MLAAVLVGFGLLATGCNAVREMTPVQGPGMEQPPAPNPLPPNTQH